MKSPVARPAVQASAQKPLVARTPVVVLGATGGVGRGVVEAALAAGRPVIAVARDKAGLQCLKAQHAKADLSVLPGEISSDADGERLAKALAKLGRPIGGVIAAVSGSTGRGRLLDHPAAYLRQRLDEDLLPHLAAARHLLPLLANRGGTYVLIGGPGAEQPWAGYGHRSIATAALRMLARVLHEEARSIGVRVQLLSIDSPVTTELNREHACPQWPSAIAVGQRALALVDPLGTPLAAQAVVRYADVVPGDDANVDSNDADSITSQVSDESDADAQAGADSPTEPPKDPDSCHTSDDALLPSRCLQDARTLLRNLLSPNNNKANQEPSP
ncbi:MAG TPA: SDR family oxidoreductase [Lysobacter sp.]